MNTRYAIFLLAAALMLAAGSGAVAHGGHLHAAHAWARATPPGAEVGAVYLVIHNQGDEPDRLVGVRTPAAERAEMHSTRMDNGMMKMERLESVDVAPGAHVLFEPGARHIMLTGLAQPLREGQQFMISLFFEHAGKVDARVEVLAIGATGTEHSGMDHTGDADEPGNETDGASE